MMESERDRLIDTLSDSMDRENATAFVDRVIQEAVAAARAENTELHRLWTEALGKAERLAARLANQGKV